MCQFAKPFGVVMAFELYADPLRTQKGELLTLDYFVVMSCLIICRDFSLHVSIRKLIKVKSNNRNSVAFCTMCYWMRFFRRQFPIDSCVHTEPKAEIQPLVNPYFLSIRCKYRGRNWDQHICMHYLWGKKVVFTTHFIHTTSPQD